MVELIEKFEKVIDENEEFLAFCEKEMLSTPKMIAKVGVEMGLIESEDDFGPFIKFITHIFSIFSKVMDSEVYDSLGDEEEDAYLNYHLTIAKKPIFTDDFFTKLKRGGMSLLDFANIVNAACRG